MFIVPESVYFDNEVDIRDCNIKLIKAKEKISLRLIEGLKDFEYSPDSKEYRKYKDKVGMSVFLYGLAFIAFIIDYIGDNAGLTGIVILGVVINSGFALYNYSQYKPLQKWYNETKPKVVRLYYNEWQRIYEEYCKWCKSRDEKPLLPREIPIVYNDVEIEYRRYY